MIPAKLLYINEFPETRGIVVSDGLGLKKGGEGQALNVGGRKVVSFGWRFFGAKDPILRPGRCQKLPG